MKTINKLSKEIQEAKNWIENNKTFVYNLSRNKIKNNTTQELRELNENELFLKPTWIINNLMTQTQQYELILRNTKLIHEQL